jgi:hypothetical protein
VVKCSILESGEIALVQENHQGKMISIVNFNLSGAAIASTVTATALWTSDMRLKLL